MENEEKAGVEATSYRTDKADKTRAKRPMSAKRLAVMAVFTALAYVVSFLETPPIAGFLQFDAGNVFILLISFLLGPIEGLVVCVLKESLRMIGGTLVGELANMVVTSAYLLFPAILYRYKKGLKSVIFSLCVACVVASCVALPLNRYVLFPFYEQFLGMPAAQAFASLWWVILLFNLAKTIIISLLTVLLYKRLSYLIKRWKV